MLSKRPSLKEMMDRGIQTRGLPVASSGGFISPQGRPVPSSLRQPLARFWWLDQVLV